MTTTILEAVAGLDGLYLGVRRADDGAVGEVLAPSRRWDDGSPTDETLAGTCAISIRSGSQADSIVTVESVAWALRALAAYPGERLLLLAAEECSSGEDEGEIVMVQPRVLAVL